MTKNKIVSVIMPNWNTPEDYLKTSIDSVAAQKGIDLSDVELVIIDDYSDTRQKENLNRIVDEYSQDRSGLSIQLHSNRYSKGLGSTRNTGIEMSRGEIVAVLDSDDALSEKALANVIE